MSNFYESEAFYRNELDELYKILNKIDKRTASLDPNFIHSLDDVRDACLFRIRLVEGWLVELAAFKIN